MSKPLETGTKTGRDSASHWTRISPQWLGFGGLIPFIVLAALTLIGPEGWKDWVSGGLIAYGAVILSFLGGLTWRLAVTREREPDPLYLASMAPFFAAWIALLLLTAAAAAHLRRFDPIAPTATSGHHTRRTADAA